MRTKIHIIYGATLIIAFALILYNFKVASNMNAVQLIDILDDNFSPLFDFELKETCEYKSEVVFHKWPGRKEYDYINLEYRFYDSTDIVKINKMRFCYKNITYRYLLENHQIIKKDKECEGLYNKSCGIIDTLGQILCIKENDKCPLRDISIGIPENYSEFTYDNKANIYYNTENYDGNTIIGKLILNDGKPCYNNERLWKKFYSNELTDENHLTCINKILGKSTDDRFEERGSIEYKQLYEDNLPPKSKELVIPEIKNNEKVSLYKRVFIGIDRECDSKNSLSKEKFSISQDNQDSLMTMFYVKGSFFIIIFLIICCIYCSMCRGTERDFIHCQHAITGVCVVILLCFIIPEIISISKVVNNSGLSYDCSDFITNEIINDQTEKTEDNINKFYIVLGLDCFYILYLLIVEIANIFGWFDCKCRLICLENDQYSTYGLLRGREMS